MSVPEQVFNARLNAIHLAEKMRPRGLVFVNKGREDEERHHEENAEHEAEVLELAERVEAWLLREPDGR